MEESDYQRILTDMHKYLPFLEKFIERMKCLAGDTDKVRQMEQLHQILLGNTLKESINLDDLKECQKVLMEIYDDSDDNEKAELQNTYKETMKNYENAFSIDTVDVSNNRSQVTSEQIESNINITQNDNESITDDKNSAENEIMSDVLPTKDMNNAQNTEENVIEALNVSEIINAITSNEVDTDSLQNNAENLDKFHDSNEDKNDYLKDCSKELNAIDNIGNGENENLSTTKLMQLKEDDTISSKLTFEDASNEALLTKSGDCAPILDHINSDMQMKYTNSEDSHQKQSITENSSPSKTSDCLNEEDYDNNIEPDDEMILPDEAKSVTSQSEFDESDEELSATKNPLHVNDNTTKNSDNCSNHSQEELSIAKEKHHKDNTSSKGHNYSEHLNEKFIESRETLCYDDIANKNNDLSENSHQVHETVIEQVNSTKESETAQITMIQESTEDSEQTATLPQQSGETDSCVNDPLQSSDHIFTLDADETRESLESRLNKLNSEKGQQNTDNKIDDKNIGSNHTNKDETIKNNDDDDDDDVQIIECNNSPICILSDDDDTKSDTVTITAVEPAKQPDHRFFARKSTNKPQPKAAPPPTETVELLDSSDDESNVKIVYARKRKLLDNKSYANKTPKRPFLLPRKDFTGGVNKNVPSKSMLPQNSGTNSGETAKVPQTYKSTPQSNFLNAINLQPASSDENPPAFCAKISNKHVIIPNAFYGNPKRIESPADKETVSTNNEASSTSKAVNLERESIQSPASSLASGGKKNPTVVAATSMQAGYRRWLDNFLLQFSKPRHLATHSCFVLLQRVLKFKIFTRIKDMRTRLNTMAHSSSEHIDLQLYQNLREMFYEGKQLSEEGVQFCQLASTEFANNVTLTTDALTGVVSSRTCSIADLLRQDSQDVDSVTRKRNDEDTEYTPGKQYADSINTVGIRRKSLRKQRSRCYDERFFYDEADMEESLEELERKEAEVELQRKVDEKRLQAQQQREKQAKSFENAYIEMFTKNTKQNYQISKDTANLNSTNSQRICTLEELNDEPKQHRIYKVIPTKLVAAHSQSGSPKETAKLSKSHLKNSEPEVIICDDVSSDTSDSMNELVPLASKNSKKQSQTNMKDFPQNTNIDFDCMSCKAFICVICKDRTPRIVDHYVNKHKGAEVYNSRLQKSRIERLRRNKNNSGILSQQANGQMQYEALCVFCNRTKRFVIAYWQHHYSMHTGEYAYRCTGCNLRKSTRSALAMHVNRSCKRGSTIVQDYQFDQNTNNIEATICTLCNYTQLNRVNIVRHLHTQHNIKQIQTHHIETIVLLSVSGTPNESNQSQSNSKRVNYESTTDDQPHVAYECDEYMEEQAGQWDETDATDDLSYMILDILNVQMDTN